ncbi:MAG: hypothetical protein J5845_00880 [Lachnospiraceae bacterium]|nr:hypothetical protein [Lachnospiraceae bacterium]
MSRRKKKQHIPKRAKIVLSIVAVAFVMWIGLLAVIFAPKTKKAELPKAGKLRTMETAEVVRLVRVREESNGMTFDKSQVTYDAFGRPVKIVFSDEDGEYGYADIRYNEEGRLESIREYSEDRCLQAEYKYVYMENVYRNKYEPIAVCMKYSASGEKEWTKKYLLSGFLRLIQYSEFEGNDTRAKRSRSYSYNDAGNITNMHYTEAFGIYNKMTDFIMYFYSGDGLLSLIQYGYWAYDDEEDQQGEKVVTSQTEFLRSNGRYTEIREKNEKTGEQKTTPCVYDAKGNLVSPIIINRQIPSAGISIMEGSAAYDEENRLRVWVNGNPDSMQARYEFNEDGQIAGYTLTVEAGLIRGDRYEYEKMTVYSKWIQYTDETWFLLQYRNVK